MCLEVVRYVILMFCVNSGLTYNANLPYSVLSECKEYQIDNDYKYREAFAISNMKNNKPYENEIFRLKFFVFTKNDAHMLITNEPRAQPGDSAYEIVLGGAGNTESVIKMHKMGQAVLYKKGAITSPLYPTELVVALRDDGEISVTLPDYERPYMSFKDKSARFWTYFSLSGFHGVGARWFYDCPLGNDGPS